MSVAHYSEAQKAIADRILCGFRERYVRGAPFAEDRALADELVLEARPTVEALVFATAHAAEDPNQPEHHEALAMVTLLGRRAGALGATPTAAYGLVPAIAAGFYDADQPLAKELVEPLAAVCLEGYVAGREDAIYAGFVGEDIESAAIVSVVPRGLALILTGDKEAEVLSEIVERFGRALLKADATACIVDLSRLDGPAPDRAAEVFSAHATARMIGARTIFAGASEAWIDAAKKTRVETELLVFEPTFEAALRRMLPLCGLELKRTSWLPGPIKSLLKSRE
jgi:hypothetical protein